jgi:4-hydroxybenzoate polyprenyltransferase
MSDTDIKPYTDIQAKGWISRLPQSWQPYAVLMRLDRPIGWWLLLLPGWWGIMLGANGVTGMYTADWRLMVLFLVGAIIMRGAGCIINDLWDRDLDKQVERTKMRPLASGQVSVFHALAFLFSLLFTAFIILLQTSWVTIGLGMLSMVFVATYPLMKRITWWPQAFLGLTFNFGALMGWGAATHHLGWEPFILYAAGFFWTMGYDTVYAHQDKADDQLVGIKSTALLFGDRSKIWVGLFYFIAMVLITLASVLAGSGLISLALLVLPALHLWGQIRDWDLNDQTNSLLVFKSNRNFGLLVLFSFAFSDVLINLDHLYKYLEEAGMTIPHIGF